MINHTMQEIADFFGACVVKEQDGSIWVYRQEPVIGENCDSWGTCLLDKSDRKENYCFCLNMSWIVTDADTHDWRVLVEPTPKTIRGKICRRIYQRLCQQ